MALKNVIFSLISGSKFLGIKKNLMKKIALLFLTILTVWSCGDEVEFNTPGFSGNKNYNLWRATYYNGVVANGKLKITAGNNSEQMRFKLSSPSVGTYLLTTTSYSNAEFTDFEVIDYSTSNPPDPSVSLYPEIGEIKITESTPTYVTGTFRFIAFTNDGLKSVGFNEGDFYRIPISGGIDSGTTLTCQEATTNVATAAANFAEVAPGDSQYTTRCTAYKTALQQAITSCGDENGAFQILITGLGNCD